MNLSEIPLFPIMKLDTAKYGKIDFGPDFADRVIANANANVLKIAPFIDLDHEGGASNGWITKVYKGSFKTPAGKDVPAVMADVEWTGKGKEAIKSGEFRYISPSIGEYKDEETGQVTYPVLKSAALTNTPVLKLMPAVTLSENGEAVGHAPLDIPIDLPAFELAEAPADAGALLHPLLAEMDGIMAKLEAAYSNLPGARALRVYLKEARAKLARMNLRAVEAGEDHQRQPEGGKNMNEELRKLLNLSEGATEADAAAKLKELAEASGTREKELADLKTAKEAADKELADLKGNLSEKDKEFGELVKTVTGLELKLAERDRDAFIDKALAENKILPAVKETWQKLYLSDPAMATDLLATMKPAVDMGEHGSGDGEGGGAGKHAFEVEVEKHMSEKGVGYVDAVRAVSTEKPDLAKSYTEGK